MKKIIFTGGGSAGHVYPIIALLPYFQDYEIHYIGTKGIEKDIISKYKNVNFHEIDGVKLIRKFTLKNLLIPFKLFSIIKSAKKIIRQIKPNIIFSKGGFVAVPVVFAGKQLGIPIVSHESDLTMGLANKIILKNCNAMCTTFLETSKGRKNCIFTGPPIRKELQTSLPSELKNKFTVKKPILLIVGGSLGAKSINDKITENIDNLLKYFNIIHITGKGNSNDITRENYFKTEYADDIASIYSCADIVISRAGSGVINELLYLKKPMLLIPLSKKCSRGDQIDNANLFKKLGYAEVLEEGFKNEELINKLLKLQKNRDFYKQNMDKSKIENANKTIFEIIKKYEKKE